MKKHLALWSASALLVLAAPGAGAQTSFSTVELRAGMRLIKAEVAASEPERQQGLMHRDKMAPNAGMVFVFGEPASQCMWMKNTLLPLSVAFIDANGKIVNIEDMQPQKLDNHCSTKGVPVKYALEMNLGWFKKYNIKPGTTIEGLPRAK